jgi:hypothetical protein
MNFGTVFRLLVPQRFTQVTRLPDLNYQLSLTGLGTHPVQIQASINLTTWLPLVTFPFPNGTTRWSDVTATNFPHRFYRAVWMP